jgi:CRISPR-associated protein Cas6
MLDLLFDLRGERLPVAYPFPLWAELARHAPALAEDARVGVLPLKVAENGEHLLLARRTRLALRIPQELAAVAAALVGAELDIPPDRLTLGEMKTRPLQPYPTLHAPLALGPDDEIEFMEAVQARFDAQGISANTICGMRRTLSDGRQSVSGYSLVVHDLKPEASLLLQSAGMGEGGRYGCGIFVPYKVISDLE